MDLAVQVAVLQVLTLVLQVKMGVVLQVKAMPVQVDTVTMFLAEVGVQVLQEIRVVLMAHPQVARALKTVS